MLRPENRCGPAALASADSQPCTNEPAASVVPSARETPRREGPTRGDAARLGLGGKNKRADQMKHGQLSVVPGPALNFSGQRISELQLVKALLGSHASRGRGAAAVSS